MENTQRVVVRSSRKDRQLIVAMLRRGWESAWVLRRASILHQLDQGQRTTQIAANQGVVPKTVRSIARRFEEGTRSGKARVDGSVRAGVGYFAIRAA